jgi:hypothetical protein
MLSNTSTPSCTFFSTLSISPWSFRVAPMTALKDSQTPSTSHFLSPSLNTSPAKLRPRKRMTTPAAPSIPFRAHRPSPLLPTPPFFAIELPKASITSTLALSSPSSQQFRSSGTLCK